LLIVGNFLQIKYVPQGKIQEGRRSADLNRTIHERGPLLVYDGQSVRRDLRSNAADFLKKLNVAEVQGIDKRMEFLAKKQVSVQTTACVLLIDNVPTLLVVSKGELDS
jgi:hypothetical protein